MQRVENSGGIQASLSGRYATALFDLAREGKAIDAVSASLQTLKSALADSEDFRNLTTSPVVSRAQAGKAIAAAAAALGVDPLTTNFLPIKDLSCNSVTARLASSTAPPRRCSTRCSTRASTWPRSRRTTGCCGRTARSASVVGKPPTPRR